MNSFNKFLLAIVLTIFWACGDDSENVDQPITQEDIDNIASMDEASSQYFETITLSNEIFDDIESTGGRIHQCHTIEETGNDKEVKVTFEGTCTGADGKVRSGSILLNWTGEIFGADFSYGVTFMDYVVDGYQVAGTVTTSEIIYGANTFSFVVVVNDGAVVCPDSRSLTYEQDLTFTFNVEEEITFSLNGSISGTNKDGISYVATTQEPVLFTSECEFAVSGVINATFNGRAPLSLDYGDGTCNDQATLSRGSESVNITLD